MTAAARLPVGLAVLSGLFGTLTLGMMLFWLVPHSGGRLPLDLRFPSYGVEEAAIYLHLLPFSARDIYSGPVFYADLAFSVLLGATLAMWARAWGAMLWPIGAGAFVLADWAENIAIKQMLGGLPDLPAYELVLFAAYATLTKFVALIASLVLIGLLMARTLSRRTSQ